MLISEIMFFLAGSLVSWLVTHCYYKKNLKNQENELSKQINAWKILVEPHAKNTQETLKLQYIELAVDEYKKTGTPVKVIDTFNISNNEKSDVYNTVMMRVKGRLGKSNPYRK